jgi:hypothetical protein
MSTERCQQYEPQIQSSLYNTVENLRRIRTAAVKGKNHFWKPVKNNALLDAENLGRIAGNFISICLTDISDGKIELEEWLDAVADLRKKYRKYDQSTHIKSSVSESVNLMIRRINSLNKMPNNIISWELTENNNFGTENVDELMSKDIGIISPLSSDYLMISIYNNYLEKTSGKMFLVKPAALSSDLKDIVLPKCPNDDFALRNVSEIGVFINIRSKGDTGRTLFEAIKKKYPGKTIHKPSEKRTAFTLDW